MHDELDDKDFVDELLDDETSEWELHDNELLLQLLEKELWDCDDEDEELEMLFLLEDAELLELDKLLQLELIMLKLQDGNDMLDDELLEQLH